MLWDKNNLISCIWGEKFSEIKYERNLHLGLTFLRIKVVQKLLITILISDKPNSGD